jgi:hypothetical protein
MPETVQPYIERFPKDLITAEDWNEMQIKIKNDIQDRVDKAIADKKEVDKSKDAAKLAGKTPEELTQQIIDAALQELNKRTGYMRVFRMLVKDKESIVKHELKDFPVTDAYQLEAFEVVCSEDDIKERHEVLFYLFHSSERKIRTRVEGENGVVEVDILGPGEVPHRIPFAKMLEIYKVQYDDDTTLGDLETEFWDAFYAPPNERFDDDLDCHSPWFDRCCGEKRTVGELKKRGDWDEIWFQTRPAKTVNTVNTADESRDELPEFVRVDHYDFDTLGVTYNPPAGDEEPDRLPVMLLLKV